MNQGIQTNFPHAALKKSGCYFFCLAEWAERECGVSFSEHDLISFFELARMKEFVNKDAFILSPAQLLNLLANTRKFSRILITEKPPSMDRFVVYVEKPGYGHFLLHDKGDLWDPLDPARPGAVGYKPVSYRKII